MDDRWMAEYAALRAARALVEADDRERTSPTCSMVRLPSSSSLPLLTPGAEEAVDQINARALQVVDRVQQKLTGAFSLPVPSRRPRLT